MKALALTVDSEAVRHYLTELQQNICEQLAAEDGVGTFEVDHWIRAEGGGGCTRVLNEGSVIERAGVNFSHISGNALPYSATHHRTELTGCPFEAMGVSVVIHPHNPYVPTSHANVRFFKIDKPNRDPVWWFGGGFDLTPYYAFEEDCIYWHTMAAAACGSFSTDAYPRFKTWCDQYFYLKHRNESRGIGGIFFDDLNEASFEHCFAFMRQVGETFIKAYRTIMSRRKQLSFGERERAFQLYRRGRYVEFNLVYDRGTLFGLQSGGRTESILMSLPPKVQWDYNWQPEPESPEAKLYSHFLKAKDWLSCEVTEK